MHECSLTLDTVRRSSCTVHCTCTGSFTHW